MNITAAMEILNGALSKVNAGDAVRRALSIDVETLRIADDIRISLQEFNKIVVIGAGKATAEMARALEDVLDGRIKRGAIIVKYLHTKPLRFIQQYEAGHPIPDTAGVSATEKLLETVENIDAQTLVIMLLSGGGSALFVAPAVGIELVDKQATTQLLLRAGADIAEINAVRKHLSAVKGGLLARRLCPARVVGLVVSDVPGDRLDVIASGPLWPDSSTFHDALSVIRRYNLEDSVPRSILQRLQQGARGELAETPKPNDPCFAHVDVVIVAGISQALQAARIHAARLGYRTEIVSDNLTGDVHVTAEYLAELARAKLASMQNGNRVCLLSGGETTINLWGNGLGGRNQELALEFAREIKGCAGITMMSVGTDGTDGPTDAAGAIVDGETWVKAYSLGIDAERMLEDNDSFHFFTELDTRGGTQHHIKTGPTGTNVMDMHVVLIDR